MNPPPQAVQDFYDDPLVYDILHTPGTHRELEVLLSLHRRHGLKRSAKGSAARLWLEPACGTGRFVRLLARRGHRVAAFDRSEAMLAYARRRLDGMGLSGRVRLFRAEMTRFAQALKPHSVAFAFNTINTLRHLGGDEEVLAHLEEMARVLHPHGVYVVGVSLSAYGRELPTEDIWEGRRGRCHVQQIVQYLPPEGSRRGKRREHVLSHLIVRRPRGTEHRDHAYELHCFDRRQWHDLLRRSPLSIREITSDRGRPMADHDGNYFLYVLEPRASAAAGGASSKRPTSRTEISPRSSSS